MLRVGSYRDPNGGQIAGEIGEDAITIILQFRGSNSVNGWCLRVWDSSGA